MAGQCLKETRLIRMPPHFAYDDPNLRFSSDRKPVPARSTVLYQITIREWHLTLPKSACKVRSTKDRAFVGDLVGTQLVHL